jgi:hypothetical protein
LGINVRTKAKRVMAVISRKRVINLVGEEQKKNVNSGVASNRAKIP